MMSPSAPMVIAVERATAAYMRRSIWTKAAVKGVCRRG